MGGKWSGIVRSYSGLKGYGIRRNSTGCAGCYSASTLETGRSDNCCQILRIYFAMVGLNDSRRENLNAKDMVVWNQLGWCSRRLSAREMGTLRKSNKKLTAWILWRVRVCVNHCHLYQINRLTGKSNGHLVVRHDMPQLVKSKFPIGAERSPSTHRAETDGIGYNEITNIEGTLLVRLERSPGLV